MGRVWWGCKGWVGGGIGVVGIVRVRVKGI